MGKYDHLSARLLVHRVSRGPNPFGWKIYVGDFSHPVHVSSARFVSLELAHRAGQVGLERFLSSQSAIEPVIEVVQMPGGNHQWRRQSRR